MVRVRGQGVVLESSSGAATCLFDPEVIIIGDRLEADPAEFGVAVGAVHLVATRELFDPRPARGARFRVPAFADRLQA